MPHCRLDHIAIAAPDLQAGVEYVRSALGVPLQTGGEHVRMGTHNCLLRLGEDMYLEVIAPNPQAPKPDRRRWFALDELSSDTSPRLATWVVNTPDIRATLAASTEPLGDIEPMSRGDLNWLITIPRDGSLPLAGIAPTLIQWGTDTHPASRMQDAGCSLHLLQAFHPDAVRITALLESIGFQGNFSISPLPAGERPYMIAHIDTPAGLRHLS